MSSLVKEWVRYGDNDRYTGYLTYPKRAPLPLPAVLVIQEAWGVDAFIESVSHRLALAGYAVFAPDLYAADGVRPPLLTRERMAELQSFVNELPHGVWQDQERRTQAIAQLPEPLRGQIEETHGAFVKAVASDRHIEPLLAATSYLRRQQGATRGQHVASIGFCLGGALSARLAAEDGELAAAVVFYGKSPGDELVPRINAPILGLYGELDPPVNGTVPAFAAAAERHGKRFEQHTYRGAQHAFFNDNRPSYNLPAARDAFVRVLSFLQQHLA
jgi:carboxymethylenebutenolidase